jgi:hypothetical protein
VPRHTLSDDFEYKGLWWLPDHPENKVAGIVSFDGETITLELLGLLRTDPDFADVEHFLPDIILGNAEGKLITLYRAFEVESSIPWSDMADDLASGILYTSSFIADDAFIGAHFESVNAIQFGVMSASFTHLEEWMGREHVPFTDNLEKGWNRSASYVRPEPIENEVSAIESTIALGAGFNKRGKMFRSLTWEHNAFITVHPVEPKGLDWYETVLGDLQNLFTLLIGRPTYIRALIGRLQREHEGRERGELQRSVDFISTRYSRPLREEFEPSPIHWNWRNVLVPYTSVESSLGQILITWFDNTELLRPIHNLFFGTLYNRRMYGEAKFLSLVQALESYHARSARKDRYVPDEEFDGYVMAMLAALPQHLKSILEPRLPYLNRYSLKTRLDELLKRVTPYVLGYITEEPSKFARRIVDTRNYLTHYDEKQKNRALSPEDILEVNPRLQLWLIALLLHDAGANVSSVAEAVHKFAGKNYVKAFRR